MQALNNALVPQIGVPGLNILVNQGIVLINGGEVSFPTTLVGLTANSTSWVFINIGGPSLQVNNTGFPANSYPIAVVITNNTGVSSCIDYRPDYVITGSNTGISGRFILSYGTPLTTGRFTLTGWGTAAAISVNGKDSAHQITLTAGAAPSQGATVQLLFADGAWNSAPLVFVDHVSTSTGMVIPVTSSTTTTTYLLTFNGLPIAGKTYILNILVVGLS